MNATEGIKLLQKLEPQRKVRIVVPIVAEEVDMLGKLRSMGFFAHLEGSAYSDLELVINEANGDEEVRSDGATSQCEENAG